MVPNIPDGIFTHIGVVEQGSMGRHRVDWSPLLERR